MPGRVIQGLEERKVWLESLSQSFASQRSTIFPEELESGEDEYLSPIKPSPIWAPLTVEKSLITMVNAKNGDRQEA